MSVVDVTQPASGQTKSVIASFNGPKEETVPFIAEASPQPSEGKSASSASSKSARVNNENADARWEEAFANTTPQQWAKLEQIFREDEKEGLLPLDFAEL